jgi:DNA-binding MarR family transcriptional regulator
MSKKNELHHFFLRKKPVMILINLAKDAKKRYASVLAKEVDCTYSHTVRVINILKKNGLVDFSRDGRTKTIQLTSAGKEIAESLSKTVNLFDKIDRD